MKKNKKQLQWLFKRILKRKSAYMTGRQLSAAEKTRRLESRPNREYEYRSICPFKSPESNITDCDLDSAY